METLLPKIIEKDGKHIVSARELYIDLGFEEKNWARWSKQNITGNPYAFEGEDYITLVIMTSEKRGNYAQDYGLTIPFAKKLAMLAKTEAGNHIREYFLECEKKVITEIQARSPEELLLQSVQLLVQHSDRISKVETTIKLLEAKSATRPEGVFTVAGWGSLNDIPINLTLAARLGKRCVKLSKELDQPVDKVFDPRFGTVGVYTKLVLEKAFNEFMI